jgi:hypothetical protein
LLIKGLQEFYCHATQYTTAGGIAGDGLLLIFLNAIYRTTKVLSPLPGAKQSNF